MLLQNITHGLGLGVIGKYAEDVFQIMNGFADVSSQYSGAAPVLTDF
jgi:hypothetical protein